VCTLRTNGITFHRCRWNSHVLQQLRSRLGPSPKVNLAFDARDPTNFSDMTHVYVWDSNNAKWIVASLVITPNFGSI